MSGKVLKVFFLSFFSSCPFLVLAVTILDLLDFSNILEDKRQKMVALDIPHVYSYTSCLYSWSIKYSCAIHISLITYICMASFFFEAIWYYKCILCEAKYCTFNAGKLVSCLKLVIQSFIMNIKFKFMTFSLRCYCPW